MLDAIIPWQRNYKYLGVTLDKIYTSEIISSVLEILHYKARLGAVLGRKSKLSRRNKRTIYKMCIRTVMTYASPVFAHAAPKHYIDYRDLELPTISKYMKDASKRFFDIAGSHPNALLARRLTINRRIPTIRHRPKLPYSTRPPLTASGRREEEPTRDGFLRHPMPRRLPGVVHSMSRAVGTRMCRPAASVKLSKSSDLSSDSSRPTK
ncbi:hypothetical protein EVAR_76304_1 [Eumeta japonica]|uniref:RNA-directed DNA polymerase from mobile element jockey n=1 Tax=Eumeta variegata TaxID=151549 RepID=A0A4C1T8B0_EUMVA|nr:hypothetical protein EVAR_76304_1 [Eumeta japonica]